MTWTEGAGAREPHERTDQHPHREADPRALVQLHHEVDVDEDAQDGEGRQERHLQQDEAAVSALAERGLAVGPVPTVPQIHPGPCVAASAWGRLGASPAPALDPQAPPRTPHARTLTGKPGRREFGSEPTAKESAIPTFPSRSFPGVGRLRFITKAEHFSTRII